MVVVNVIGVVTDVWILSQEMRQQEEQQQSKIIKRQKTQESELYMYEYM